MDDSEETALRKEEVEIDNYREFLIRVYIGVRTSSMIYRVVSDLVLNRIPIVPLIPGSGSVIE